MLTITTEGKSASDALTIVKNAITSGDGVKVLVDGPAQAETLRKFLEAQGYFVMLEDDDGTLYLTASKEDSQSAKTPAVTPAVTAEKPAKEENAAIGVIISGRNRDINSAFMKKFLLSLLKAETKPDIIALLDAAVKIAAYNSPLCVTLKKLEAVNVRILISEQCATRLGVNEAAGAGIILDMAEILDEIFSCSKIVSI